MFRKLSRGAHHVLVSFLKKRRPRACGVDYPGIQPLGLRATLRIPEEYQRIQAKSIHESAKILANILADSQCFDSAPTQKASSHPRAASSASSGPSPYLGQAMMVKIRSTWNANSP